MKGMPTKITAHWPDTPNQTVYSVEAVPESDQPDEITVRFTRLSGGRIESSLTVIEPVS